ncbi:MAG: hypothetical protein CL847_02750 [Crocinitomicaceae bacterium]|nr:hypothetical protein [Crocinitomicaceae bacterium]
MKLIKNTLLLLLVILGFQSCDLCPGERPVIIFVNNGYCNCDVTISENDERHVLGGESIEVTLFSGSYDLSANCTSSAYLNDQLSILEQIGCDLNQSWSTSVELVCGDEYTFTVN